VTNTLPGPLDREPDVPGWWIASDGKWYPPEARTVAVGGADQRRAGPAAYCGACGIKAEPGAIFCENCGSDLRAPAPAPYPPATVGRALDAGAVASGSRTDAWMLLVAAGLVVVGSFLPWVKATAVLVGTLTKSGTEGGDGWIAIALVVPLGIFGIRRLSTTASRVPGLVALAFTAVLGALVIYEIADASHKVADVNNAIGGYGHAEVGVGLWMVLVGAITAVVGSLIAISQPKVS
jgi:hypothetical protein